MAPGSNNAGAGVQQGMPDPIGALQNLARQGTGNNTNMGMQVPGSNPQNIVPQQPPNGANPTNRKLNYIFIFKVIILHLFSFDVHTLVLNLFNFSNKI